MRHAWGLSHERTASTIPLYTISKARGAGEFGKRYTWRGVMFPIDAVAQTRSGRRRLKEAMTAG